MPHAHARPGANGAGRASPTLSSQHIAPPPPDSHPLPPPQARLESWSPFANVSLAEWNGALHMFRCNKFSLEDGLGYETHGLFPRLSRLNHSCSPSAVRHVVGNFALLFARRDVAAGEEVTMRYSPEEGHGKCTDQFTCGCRLTITQRRAASTADADAAKKFALAGGKPAAANPLVPRTAQPRPPGAGAGAPAKSAGAAKRPAAGPAAGAPPTGRPRVAAGGGGGARAVAAAAGRSSK